MLRITRINTFGKKPHWWDKRRTEPGSCLLITSIHFAIGRYQQFCFTKERKIIVASEELVEWELSKKLSLELLIPPYQHSF